MTIWLELIDDFVASKPNWKAGTARWYHNRLRALAEYLASRDIHRPEEVELRHLIRYLSHLRRTKSYYTHNGSFTAISVFWRWLKRHGLVETNPFLDPESELKRPRRPRVVRKPLPRHVVTAMISAAEADTEDPRCIRDAAIMRLLISTGIRREELIRLTLDDVDLSTGEVHIHGKFDHERLVFIFDETVIALRRWLEVRPDTFTDRLFVGFSSLNKRGPLRAWALNTLLCRWRDAAGFPRISVGPHRWRRTFASWFIKYKIGDLSELQHAMGHADIATTRLYVTVEDETVRKRMAEYSRRLRVVR